MALDLNLVIGVGGDSSIDVVKVASVLASYEGDILDHVAPSTGERKPVPGSGIPIVCIPTIAGTGSETSPVSVISLPDRRLKVGISD